MRPHKPPSSLNFCRSEGTIGDQPIDCHSASLFRFRGVARKSHDEAFVIPNFDGESIRLR